MFTAADEDSAVTTNVLIVEDSSTRAQQLQHILVQQGYDVIHAANLVDVPVILVTTLSDPSDVIRGLEWRADHFMLKPYDER